jgi:signal transduction histidine kinase
MDMVVDSLWLLVVAATFLAGRAGSWTAAVAAGAATCAVAFAVEAPIPVVLTVVAAYLVGRALRERSQIARRLEERAGELEAERESYAQLSVRYERARIASELHDIVAHAISVMVVQAAAGQRLAAVDPEATAEAFAAIGGAARQAEQDLERLVALLVDEDVAAEAPDLALVEELVARAAQTGLDVRLELSGDRDALPARVVQTIHRVVQESLTNALRYAGGAPVRVAVHGDRDVVTVEVRNAAADAAGALEGAGTGNGLRGLRERLGEIGGALDAGPTGDGGWAVRARLPRTIATA